MGKNKGPFLRTLPLAQGGSTGCQREVPIGLHASDRRAVLEGHRPPPPRIVGLHQMDQTGELLPWVGGSTGPPPEVPPLGWDSATQVAQILPSESWWDSHKRVETLAAGSSEPSTGATVAPIQETPTKEPPVTEPPVTETPVMEAPATCSDTPAPMEIGRGGDGQSWAEQVEAGLEVEFQQDRPTKCHRSQSRK